MFLAEEGWCHAACQGFGDKSECLEVVFRDMRRQDCRDSSFRPNLLEGRGSRHPDQACRASGLVVFWNRRNRKIATHSDSDDPPENVCFSSRKVAIKVNEN